MDRFFAAGRAGLLCRRIALAAASVAFSYSLAPSNLSAASPPILKEVDRDKDFLIDKDELRLFGTSPKSKDSDGNGILDGDEDFNGDGIPNEDEDDRSKKFKLRTGNTDSDKDGVNNEDENDWGLNPKKKDSDGDGVVDGLEDFDGDGIPNKKDKKNDAAPTPGPTSTPTATPAEGYQPTPTATPTPTSNSNGNFDSNGDVTIQGKVLFGIPSNLSANITRGKNAHDMNCNGCHTGYLGRTFSTLRSKIAESPMYFTTSSIPDATLADITAYLNRFRP